MKKIFCFLAILFTLNSCLKPVSNEPVSFIESGAPWVFRGSNLWWDVFKDANYDAIYLVNYTEVDSLIQTEIEIIDIEDNIFYPGFDSEENRNRVDSIKMNNQLYDFEIPARTNFYTLEDDAQAVFNWDIHLVDSNYTNSITIPDGFENLRLERESYAINDEIRVLWDNPDDQMIRIQMKALSFSDQVNRIQDIWGIDQILSENNGEFSIIVSEEVNFDMIDLNRTFILLTFSKRKDREYIMGDMNTLFGVNYTHHILFEIDRL